MEKRTHLYVSRKNVGTWLMTLCMIASVVIRIWVLDPVAGVRPWLQIILPSVATVLFVLITLLGGKEMFYKTAIPVWIWGICFGALVCDSLSHNTLLMIVLCVCALFFCISYTAITSGTVRWPWLLLPLYLILAGLLLYAQKLPAMEALPMKAYWYVMPEYLMVAGQIFLLFALKIHTDGKYHPTWGDRAEGRRIRSIQGLDLVGPYFMVNRTGANNLYDDKVEISNMERYIRQKRREGMQSFGATHVLLAAYVRTVAKFPALNRFMAGQRLYTRGRDICVSMTVKKEMSLKAPDSLVKAHFDPADTAAQVYEKFNAQVAAAKDEMEESGVDSTIGVLSLIPGVVLKFVIWLLKTLDYFGVLPGFLIEFSPFHSSAYFTSMGSLGIRPVYHHLYDFGTVPVFCSFGRKRREEVVENGEIVEKKFMELRFNLDERICDGYHYASIIKYYFRLLAHPEVLDQPPETVEEDVP